MLKNIITGTGRCGTVYAAKLLTSVGCPCGHEVFFDHCGLDGAAARMSGNWPKKLSDASTQQWTMNGFETTEHFLTDLSVLTCESSYMAAPYLAHEKLQSVRIIQLVRNPRDVINSFLNHLGYFQSSSPSSVTGKHYEKFIYDNLPELKGSMTPAERASLYYIRWNEMIETNAFKDSLLRIRVEDGPQKILSAFGLTFREGMFDDREANSINKKPTQFSFDQIPRGRIKQNLLDISTRYGYSPKFA